MTPIRRNCAIIEVVCGWAGFLGIGQMLVGHYEAAPSRTFVGVILLLTWWFALFCLLAASSALGGLALVLGIPIWLVVPLLSGLSFRYWGF